jgi:hypothetical protein
MTGRTMTMALPEIISQEVMPFDVAPPRICRLEGVRLKDGVSLELRVQLDAECVDFIPVKLHIESVDPKLGSCELEFSDCLPKSLLRHREVALDARYLLDCSLTEDGLTTALKGAMEAVLQPRAEISIINLTTGLLFELRIDDFFTSKTCFLDKVGKFLSPCVV